MVASEGSNRQGQKQYWSRFPASHLTMSTPLVWYKLFYRDIDFRFPEDGSKKVQTNSSTGDESHGRK